MTRRRVLSSLIVAVVLAACAGPVAGAEAACPAQPSTLSPGGPGPARFTMLLRVNQPQNAQTYANPDAASGGLAGRVRPQDLFVVNTRFDRSSPTTWSKIVAILRQAFPCNRIVALNGLGADPNSPGYAYALYDSPQVWALLTDWEKLDWYAGRWSNPAMGPWTGRFRTTEKRVRRWIGGITYSLGLTPATSGKRAGLVPQYRDKWDYGLLARAVSGAHRRLGPNRRGIQSVQTQDYCAAGGGRGMKAIAGRLVRSYKLSNFRRIKREGAARKGKGKRFRYVRRKWKTNPGNLGLQISFSNTPSPGAGMAILSTSPTQAAKCTLTALKRGGGAFLYWAAPESMRALLATGPVCALRPSSTGVC